MSDKGPEHQNRLIEKEFYKIFDRPLSNVNQIRLEGKKIMLHDGNFLEALDNCLITSYISLEKLDVKNLTK